MREAEAMERRRKEQILDRVKEILEDYLFDSDEKRAVIHMEFEKTNGESQSKTLWFVKDGYRRDGKPGKESLETVRADELAEMRFYPSFFDNQSRTY